jgi:predicted small lipoprotein YifL
MKRRLTALAATIAVLAVPLAGCGDEGPGIPKRDATELVRLLKKAQTASDNPESRCDSLLATVAKLNRKVGELPSDTDRDVRDTLANGVRNLAQSSATLCKGTQTTPTETTPPPTTETVPPVTTQTVPPVTTQTIPPPTTPTTPPPTTPTVPNSGGTGPGAGNGNGNGNGGGGEGGGNGSGSGNGNGNGKVKGAKKRQKEKRGHGGGG